MERNVRQLVAAMTAEEKAKLCSGSDYWHTHGVERLGLRPITLTDGPHGLRKQSEDNDPAGLYHSVEATCFPSAAGLASSWNRALLEQAGAVIAKECQEEDVAVLLGPGANIKRSPLCGRNFEYFSEDPYLSSELAAHHILGVQSEGVGASLKHFAANNQETRRMTVDAVIDERTLREIYLASFETAVKKAKPWTVMCAYNRVNGQYASEHRQLLTDILRKEWEFEGVVVSDWGAVNDRVAGLSAGLELEMPSSKGIGERKILTALKNGSLSEAVLDQAAERLVALLVKAEKRKKNRVNLNAHHQIARLTARESMVLLKNDEKLLPLKQERTVAVIGEFAVKPRYQGGGSSHVNPPTVDSPLSEIRDAAGEEHVLYAQGYDLERENIDEELISGARRAASQADAAVIFAGLPEAYESEGFDRDHLRIPRSHEVLISEVAAVQPNVAVVLCNGAPVEMPWVNDVKSILEAYLGGQAAGGAIADLLFGIANPSGKLAETFPAVLCHNPAHLNFPGEPDRVEYREGLFIGYRYYDAKALEPLFPFGHGLSYTDFQLKNLTLSRKYMKDTETIEASVTVANTGERAGKEVVQLYIHDVNSTVIRPLKELKGFEKVALEAGEEKTVTMTLDKRSFAYYNVALRDWHVESGDFDVLVGTSSRNLPLRARVSVTSTVPLYYRVHRNTVVGDLLTDPKLAPVLKESFLAAELDPETPFAGNAQPGGAGGMLKEMMRFLPLRALTALNPEAFPEEQLDELIDRLNAVLDQKRRKLR